MLFRSGDYDPNRGPTKDVGAVVSEVAYSSRTNEASENHREKRKKNEEDLRASMSLGDEESKSSG